MNKKKRWILFTGFAVGAVTATLLVLFVLVVVVRGMMESTSRPQRWRPITPTPTPAVTPTPSVLPPTVEPSGLHVGGQAQVVARVGVRMRKTPGYEGKPATDIIAVVPPQAVVEIIGGPELVDGLRWWRIRYRDEEGWMAEFTVSGIQLLAPYSGGG